MLSIVLSLTAALATTPIAPKLRLVWRDYGIGEVDVVRAATFPTVPSSEPIALVDLDSGVIRRRAVEGTVTHLRWTKDGHAKFTVDDQRGHMSVIAL
jgi:hypothetical protein